MITRLSSVLSPVSDDKETCYGISANTTGASGSATPSFHLEQLFEDSKYTYIMRSMKSKKTAIEVPARYFCKMLILFGGGAASTVTLKIDTGMAAPIRHPPRRLPFYKREIYNREIHKMVEKDVIEL